MSPRRVPPTTGRLIVRLNGDIAQGLIAAIPRSGFPGTITDVDSVIGDGAPGLLGVLGSHPGVFTPAVDPVLAARVHVREQTTHGAPFAPIRSLLSYFIVDPRFLPTPVTLAELRRALESLPIVASVQIEPSCREPAGPWAVDPSDDYAGYDDPDSDTRYDLHVNGFDTWAEERGGYPTYGLNCRTEQVWGKYSGKGVGFIDLETGWQIPFSDAAGNGHLGHEDLPAAPLPQPLYGANCWFDGTAYSHGTESLGVVIGVDNAFGIVGIAPQANFVGVVSRAKVEMHPVAGPDSVDIVNAVVVAVEKLNPGDVLLVEVETVVGTISQGGMGVLGGAPIEIVDAWFDAIRYATANGIVVVEAAGNGKGSSSYDLDNPLPGWPMPGRSLNRALPDFEDSGALMVSACGPYVNDATSRKHEPLAGPAKGSRIDMYGWGSSVATADTSSDRYSTGFGGTSAASAMIAGAALLVQEMYTAVNRTRASPATIRSLLGDVSTGTPVGVTGRVVPDLTAIAGVMGARPDVFVRDQIGDEGVVPFNSVSQSPDIILRNLPPQNAQAAFGDGSGTEESMVPNDDVIADQVNYIYVRARNRTTVQADNVTATVYWADTMAMVPPTEWHEIGTTAPASIPAASAPGAVGPVTVLPRLEWAPRSGMVPPELPATHGCFVAVLDSPADPRPAVFPLLSSLVDSWTAFTSVLGAHNNLAFRNFNVLSPTFSGSAFEAEAAFLIVGAPVDARFDFDFDATPAEGVIWSIRPHEEQTSRLPDLDPRDGEGAERGMIRIEAGTRCFRNGIPVTRGARRCFRLHVVAPRQPDGSARLTIRQCYRGNELGRVTFVLGAPRERPRRTIVPS